MTNSKPPKEGLGFILPDEEPSQTKPKNTPEKEQKPQIPSVQEEKDRYEHERNKEQEKLLQIKEETTKLKLENETLKQQLTASKAHLYLRKCFFWVVWIFLAACTAATMYFIFITVDRVDKCVVNLMRNKEFVMHIITPKPELIANLCSPVPEIVINSMIYGLIVQVISLLMIMAHFLFPSSNKNDEDFKAKEKKSRSFLDRLLKRS